MTLASRCAMNWRRFDQPYSVTTRLLFAALLGQALLSACGSDSSPTKPNHGAAGSPAQAGSGGTAGTGGAGFDCSETAEPGELVAVPGGDFLMGCNEALDEDCSDDETPSHTLTISPF